LGLSDSPPSLPSHAIHGFITLKWNQQCDHVCACVAEASTDAGDCRDVPPALHLLCGQRGRQPAPTGRCVPRQRPLWPNLLQPGVLDTAQMSFRSNHLTQYMHPQSTWRLHITRTHHLPLLLVNGKILGGCHEGPLSIRSILFTCTSRAVHAHEHSSNRSVVTFRGVY